jgi:hypothetical protein
MIEQLNDVFREAKPFLEFVFQTGEIVEIRGRPEPIMLRRKAQPSRTPQRTVFTTPSALALGLEA